MRKAPARRTRGEYEVGWGKPPKSKRWKPGQSGNPRGRPRPRKNHMTILTEALGQKIQIQERGSARLITFLEAIIKRLLKRAVDGDMKAIDRIMEIAASLPEPVDMPQDTKDISPEEALRIYQKMIKRVG
jgi:Family of unknown function (DUF5681)